MQKRGMVPNVQTYKCLIDAYARPKPGRGPAMDKVGEIRQVRPGIRDRLVAR